MLVGNVAQVVSSRDSSLVGRTGTIVEETKNMLFLEVKQGALLKVPKLVVTLRVRARSSGKELHIEGTQLIGTPADRIKS